MYSSILSFQPFFFCFVACFHSFAPSNTFFFLCYRDLPVNQFNPNFLPSISTKTARNEFQLPLNYSFFGITEFSRSNTGFSTLTLKKYPIDPVMSWFIKRCKSCLSFSCCQSCRALVPRTCFKLVKPLSRITYRLYFFPVRYSSTAVIITRKLFS